MCLHPSPLCISVVFSSQQELAIQSKEEAYSVALHPSGLYMLVGYADKLRLMGLQIDGMRECKAFTIRACREVGMPRRLPVMSGLVTVYVAMVTCTLCLYRVTGYVL